MVANTTMLYCIGAKYNFSLQYENLTAIPISHSRQIPDKLKFNALSQYLYYKNPNFLNLYPALQNLKKHGYEHNDSYHNGRYAKETASFVSLFSVNNPKQAAKYKKQPYENRDEFFSSFCHFFPLSALSFS